jgi:hypothetical protein
VAGNLRGSFSDDIQGSGASNRSSYNLVGTGGSDGLVDGVNYNLVGVDDPVLGALANNGGPTLTMAPLAGSLALGLGDPLQAGTPDQRGVARDRPVSIGAYEGLPTVVTVSASVDTSVYGQPVTFTATVTSSGSPVTADTVTFREGTSTLGTSPLDGSGHATWTTSAFGAGSHVITAEYRGNASHQPGSGSTGLMVNRAALTITADDKTRVYGQTNPTLTASYRGFVNGDTPAVVRGSRLSTPATAGSGVGTYPITGSGASAANYTISYVSGTLTVTPAPLTTTADDKSKVAGDSVPPLTARFAGFVNGDGVSSLSTPVSLSTYSGDTAGTYPIVPSGATAANYAITFVNGTLTVTPAVAASLVISTPVTAIAGQGFSLTVTAYDPYGNVDTNYAGTISLTTTDPLAPSLGTFTYTAGVAGVAAFPGVQLFTAGPQSIFVADGSLSGQANLTVNPDVAVSLVLSGPSSATAGTPFTVTVTAYDAWGNVATGYLGTVTFSCTDAAAALPSDYAFQSGDQGTQSFQVTLMTPGTQRLTVTDTANPALTAYLDVTL